ncbi:MAG: glycosyltransferase family 4 protein [Parvibaculales bacterium]
MSFRPELLSEIWAKLGHDVVIVGASYTHLRHCQPVINGLLSEDSQGHSHRIWLRTPGYRSNGVGRFLNMLVFALLLLVRLPFTKSVRKADIYISSSTHPFDIFGVKFLAWLNGGKVVFELHDIWPESLIELGGLKSSHPFSIIVKWIRPLCYRWADGVVSMLPQAQSHIERYFGDKSKITYISNGAFPGLLEPNASAPAEPDKVISPYSDLFRAMEETSKAGRLNCVYTGYLGPQNAMSDMLEIAPQFIGRIDFHLVGDGPLRPQLATKFGKMGNVTFHGTVPLEISQACQRAADILYIGWQKKQIYRYGVTPNKLFEYFAAGKPVIQALSFADNLVARADAGFCCAAEDHKAIAEAFEKMLSMSAEERDQMGMNGRKFVREQFSYDTLACKFLDFMQDLTRECHPDS